MIDITGKHFGKLVAIRPVKKNGQHDFNWICKCDCGNIKEIRGYLLRNHVRQSCGCFSGAFPELGRHARAYERDDREIKIRCIETGKVFASLEKAGKKYNMDPSNISHVLHGRNKTAGGHHWERVDGKTVEVAAQNDFDKIFDIL
jgi:hypothetical protein